MENKTQPLSFSFLPIVHSTDSLQASCLIQTGRRREQRKGIKKRILKLCVLKKSEMSIQSFLVLFSLSPTATGLIVPPCRETSIQSDFAKKRLLHYFSFHRLSCFSFFYTGFNNFSLFLTFLFFSPYILS